MKKNLKYTALFFIGIFILIQFVPVNRENPAVQADIQAPVAIKNILKESCYDCHSFETHWPIYSYIAPVSWLVAHDVEEGREKLNFSQWETMDSRKKAEWAEHIIHEAEENEMPLPIYTVMHSSSRIDENELHQLSEWFNQTFIKK